MALPSNILEKHFPTPEGHPDTEAIISAMEEYANAKVTEYATKLQQAEEKIQKLEQWKKEALEAWGPLIDWGQSQKDIPLGTSITQGILRRLSKAQKLVDALEEIKSILKRSPGDASYGTLSMQLQRATEVVNKKLSEWNEGKEGKV